MTALIDADSMIYIIAWNHKDSSSKVDVENTCDDFVRCILGLTQSDTYIGVFSPKECFRHRDYKYNNYKGQRPDKPEWYTKWEQVIKDYLCNRWGFFVAQDLEADDIVSALADGGCFSDCVICSPDKDLRQVPGLHFDYKKQDLGIVSVSYDEACDNLWLQMLTGDDSDNVNGVPGLGPVKAKALLNSIELPGLQTPSTVKAAYVKYFGTHYGPIIFYETMRTLQLMSPNHEYWNLYAEYIHSLKDKLQHFDLNNISGTAFENVFASLGQ